MKKILSIFLLFICTLVYAQNNPNIKRHDHFGLGGWVTNIRSDMLNDRYSPDLLNVWTNKYQNLIIRREGSSDYLNSAIEGGLWFPGSYVYRQVDGDEYILLKSSTSIFYSQGDGNTTKIKSDLSSTSVPDFTIGLNTVYSTDGSTWPWKWDGTTLTSLNNVNVSTGIPEVPYFCLWWNNRMLYARTDTYTSRVWISDLDTPEYINSLSYKNINASDGDYIIGMFLYGNEPFILKRYSTWKLVEVIDDDDDPFYQIVNLSQSIGCLYKNTIREWLGFPMWLSSRGYEWFNGQFTLASEPIDPYIKSLSQLVENNLRWEQTTSGDWGAGNQFINVDTTTYDGSITLDYATSQDFDQDTARGNITLGTYPIYYRQPFYPTKNVLVTTITIRGGGLAIAKSGACLLGLYNDDMTYISTEPVTLIFPVQERSVSLDEVSLAANTTYYIWLKMYNATSAPYPVFSSATAVSNSAGDMDTSSDGSSWSGTTQYMYCRLDTIESSGSFTTQGLNAGTSWGSWGNFSANETKPSGTAITYYGQGGASTTTAAAQTKTQLTIGSPINISTGPYLLITASFSSTSSSIYPRLNSVNVGYNLTSNIYRPFSIVHDDNYYAAVTTDTTNKRNNVVLVLQKNGEWTRFNGTGMNWGSAFVYKNDLYSCDSTDTGMVRLQNVSGSYSDSGSGYESYWCSKIFNFEDIYETTILSLHPLAANSGDWDLDIDYRMHGNESGSWTTKYLNLYDATFGLISEKINLTMPKSYYFQYRVRTTNIDENFEYRGMTIRYIKENLK